MEEMDSHKTAPVLKGVGVIQKAADSIGLGKCGVYRMISQDFRVLYVGKAKDIQKRLQSYIRVELLPHRLKRMVFETTCMEFTITHTEEEALLLENNLIKTLRPIYNILLKDDKSFPYICLTSHPFPRITKYRGEKKPENAYFGPYSNVHALDAAIIQIQKFFGIRSCSDHYFNTRSRPCLQYHIKRCSAPCVKKITTDEYVDQVQMTKDFLVGKTDLLQKKMEEKMLICAKNLQFEQAATYRNHIQLLTQLQAKQVIYTQLSKSIDVIALHQDGGKSCVQVMFYRLGTHVGSLFYFLDPVDHPIGDQIEQFIVQFYQSRLLKGHACAELVILSHLPSNYDLLLQTLRHMFHKRIILTIPKRGIKYDLLEHALRNAKDAARRDLDITNIFHELSSVFGIKDASRIEVYDNSHLFGTHPYGVMIVVTKEGFDKKSYRKFSMESVKQEHSSHDPHAVFTNDYAMMTSMMERRFKNTSTLPDLLLIDGGKGQIKVVHGVLEKLNLSIPVIGIAKGENRNASQETFYQRDKDPLSFSTHTPLFYFLQRIRDEAHRFAITTHRTSREKNLTQSKLDDVPGVGAKRKKALLLRFGSVKGITSASIDDISRTEGISKALAQKILDYLR
jgi:excinuclease ABC subunit C